MELKVTHLEYSLVSMRWAMRFVGSQEDFNAIRLRLKELGRPAICWSAHYEWEYGRPGAWLITGRQLDKIRECFVNLEGTHTSRHISPNIVHACAFWRVDFPYADMTRHEELEPV